MCRSPWQREGEVEDRPSIGESLVDLPVGEFVAASTAKDVAPLVVNAPAERKGVEFEEPGNVSNYAVKTEVEGQLGLGPDADEGSLDIDSTLYNK